MRYRVERVYNNNVVLVEKDKQEVILVGKGVGFGKRQNEFIEFDPTTQKIYYETQVNPESISKNGLEHEIINKITHHIIDQAQQRFGEMNDNFPKVLGEHIQFALERLNMGLVIENPFIEQIKALYREEFTIATYGAKLIYESLGIDIGQEEMGFIALHIYSAKKDNSLRETMKVTRVYSECVKILEQYLACSLNMEDVSTKQFFRQLKYLMYMYKKQSQLQKPLVSVKKSSECYKTALRIRKVLADQKSIIFDEYYTIYLAVEIDKLMQFN